MTLTVVLAVALSLVEQAPAPLPAVLPDVSEPSTATTRLMKVREHFERLECEAVIESAEIVADHRLATPAERTEAGFRHAYCAVILGNLSDAQRVFAWIVAEDLAAEPPFPIEPRVRLLLEAARSEQRERQTAAIRAARAAAVAQIALVVTPPASLDGGMRAFFDVAVTDPPHLVQRLRLEFRKKGEPDFYALPVAKRSDGSWRGEIPGVYTASRDGVELEWFVSAVDDAGAVVAQAGGRDAPQVLKVGPGSSLARDLKAHERLTTELRVALALFGTPLLSGVGLIAGLAVPTFLSSVDELKALALGAAALLPPIGASVGTWMIAATILDDNNISIAVLGTAGIGVLWAVTMFATGASGLLELDELRAGAALVGVAALGGVVTAVVPTTLVLLDAHE